MGRGGHSDDEGTPYDQSLEEVEWLRSACAAAQRGQTEKLARMIEKRPHAIQWDGVAGTSGYTPLHYACREGHLESARLLLDKGAIVDSRTSAGGATPLHRAAFTGQTQVVQLLLSRGANPLIQDCDGQTALHKAHAQGHTETVKVLLAAGPSAAELMDNRGRTALRAAGDDRAS